MPKDKRKRGNASERNPRSRPKASDGGTPNGNDTRENEGTTEQSGVNGRFARVTAPPELKDTRKREAWDMPIGQPGPYIVELNSENAGGLPGAANAFVELYKQAIPQEANDRASAPQERAQGRPSPVRIAKSYYRCEMTDLEWHRLIAMDELKEPRQRAIYRLWPDFPVTARTDRSVSTIKADAAFRSFDATGEGITWAVIDSGVDAGHPHFGPPDDGAGNHAHSLLAESVRDLHRCFAAIPERRGELLIPVLLPDPDSDPNMKPEDRAELIERHRAQALRDDYGHGTHVAGIIAGQAPSDPTAVHVFERQYKVDKDGNKSGQTVAKRPAYKGGPRGMAPRCRLISLRVLDHQGNARSSQVIQALEYIRDRLNDNPKIMRVHGVNLSIGYEFDAEMFACGQSPLCTTVDRLAQEGVVVVAAAGNTGFGAVAAAAGTTKVGLSNTINDPGNAAQAITVGSTHRDAPYMYGVSYFSSKGPTADGRLKPDLVAPGERITSCAAGRSLDQVSDTDKTGACYIDDSGTSMAAPHVSGAVAAFLSIRREFIGRPLEVKRIFLESATSLGRERYFEGHGLLDLMRAIQMI